MGRGLKNYFWKYVPWFIVFEVLAVVVMKNTVFWDIKPYSLLNVNGRFRGTHRLHLPDRRISRARYERESRREAALSLPSAFALVSCLFYSLTLKMDVIRSSETSVDLQRTVRRCIIDDSTLHWLAWLEAGRRWRGIFVLKLIPGLCKFCICWGWVLGT
jgi:hypothetical protein